MENSNNNTRKKNLLGIAIIFFDLKKYLDILANALVDTEKSFFCE